MNMRRFRMIGLIAIPVPLIVVGSALRWGSDGRGSATWPRIAIWAGTARRNVSMSNWGIGPRALAPLAGAATLTGPFTTVLLLRRHWQ
jgi:hypothetical protein